MKTLFAVIASLALSASLHAQMAETIEVRVTNVDVVVTDGKGNPVHGLTQDDFEIFEAGKPQPITNFYEIRDSADATTAEAAASQAVPPEIGRRRIVVFVDNHSINPLKRNEAFAALEKSLDKLMRPGDEAMLVFWNRQMEVVSPFTSDRDQLRTKFRDAAVRASSAISVETMRQRILQEAAYLLSVARVDPRAMSPREAYNQSITKARAHAEELFHVQRSLLGNVTRTLDGMAGLDGKKALIYLGAELSDQPGLELFQRLDAMFQFDVKDFTPAVLRDRDRLLTTDLRKLAEQASANGVTMYLVDVADRLARSNPADGLVAPDAVFSSETNTPLAMGKIAQATGGIAVPGGKSFELALGTIVRDLSSYYSLGYRSPESGDANRRIVVKVKKPGLRVRSRGTYIARKPEEDIESRVIANVMHGNIQSDFPVSVEAATPEPNGDGNYKVKVTVTLPSTLTLIPQDNQLAGEFVVYFVTGDTKGGLSPVSKFVQPMKFPPDARPQLEKQKTLPYRAMLLVRPGEQLISVAIVDTLAGTTGFARTKVVAQ